MNLISGIKLYIEKMCTESGPGMKIILLDKETVSKWDNFFRQQYHGHQINICKYILFNLQTSIISMAFSQSDMLQREVYLFERIDSGRSNERLKYLKCIVFIRPTKQNIQLLANELRNPKYSAYFICKWNCTQATLVK